MYTKISNTSVVVFDGKTGNLIGTATFKLSDESEKALLNLLNYNEQPSSLTLLDVVLNKPSLNYSPLTPNKPYARRGTINAKALFTNANSKSLVPVEIQLDYNLLVRETAKDNPFHFESVEFDDVDILSVKIIY